MAFFGKQFFVSFSEFVTQIVAYVRQGKINIYFQQLFLGIPPLIYLFLNPTLSSECKTIVFNGISILGCIKSNNASAPINANAKSINVTRKKNETERHA